MTSSITSNKPRVLFIGDINPTAPEHSQYFDLFEVIDYKIVNTEQFHKDMKDDSRYFNLDGIFGGWPSGGGEVGKFTDELVSILKKNSPNLRLITTCTVGYDAFDLEALKRNCIHLSNTPSLGAEDVADLVLWHVLESYRYLSRFQQHLLTVPHTVKSRRILEREVFKYPFGHLYHQQVVHSPRGKKVGILGFGKIGQATGKRLSAIGMEIYYYARNQVKLDSELGFSVTYEPDLKKLVSEMDQIVLALPGNKDTFHMINEELLSHAKEGIKIVNVGRGFLIDGEAAVKALESGKIGFLGLDVFWEEPIVDEALLQRDNISVSPHIGSSTETIFNGTALFCLQNLEKVLIKGEEAESLIV
ncbi:hypothetical protein WICPIJ_008862 [Wickerhamomyces pijperi]|uniref:Uncharacterized protein n=1 Tax=Wickerhamomyces pijperi TaxID=599730 RepID=A0A9P8TGY5_WICPI|nr:hypothetical protein WICPIJ_008862 [Wickerhamomyces pijperi]